MKKVLFNIFLAGGFLALGIFLGRLTKTIEKEVLNEPIAAQTNLVVEAASTPATEELAPDPLKILKVFYRGDDQLSVVFNREPAMDAIRQYVSVEPLRSGVIAIESDEDYYGGGWMPSLQISGDFALCTNLTLRINHGLMPDAEKVKAEEALAEDFVHNFTRDNLKAEAWFVSSGRYLPPLGKRELEVKCVNMTNLTAKIRRVGMGNIVQLLAREERVYRGYYGGGVDSPNTSELSGEPTEVTFKCRNELNVEESIRLPIAMNDNGADNGVYFVSLDGEYRGCRLVCVSDLGLSVRKSADDGLGVWVTSLTTGKPIADAEVEVYAANGFKIKVGRTDELGWCRPERCDKGEPFAVVVRTSDAQDMTFVQLSKRLKVEETAEDQANRHEYLKAEDVQGFLWTDRGIYRHGEKVFAQLILRNGKFEAPNPFPVTFTLHDANDRLVQEKSLVTDEKGCATCDTFTIADDLPSGKWELSVRIPGKDGKILAERELKVEEFVPPHVRVMVDPVKDTSTTNFAFDVSAEYLFGGLAGGLASEAIVLFEDVAFAPEGWGDFSFGNDDLGLKWYFLHTKPQFLDKDGRARFVQPLVTGDDRPKAAVRATVQGTVLEEGGRPANARVSTILNYYSYYIGTTLKEWMAPKSTIKVACVMPNGKKLTEAKKLKVKLERIDPVYSYRMRDHWATWDAKRVRTVISENEELTTDENGQCEYTINIVQSGDYALTISDDDSGCSFAREFYLSEWGDETVRAPLANPTAVTIRPDKAFYRVGESPKLIVKSPFPGAALLTVMREKEIYSQVLNLTNATSEIELKSVAKENAPNLDVFISVIQGVSAGEGRFAVRAHGQTTIDVRPLENELKVELKSNVEINTNGRARVTVEIETAAQYATVTLVDEAINLLTNEPVPNPIADFASRCAAEHPLYDLYSYLLPVLADELKANGVKTGGGFGAELLSRVSPISSRRFKPLALKQVDVPITNGKGTALFDLPEFVGEVRITAVVADKYATGARAVHAKIAPKVIMMADAPRFVAPGDWFESRMTVKDPNGTSNIVYRQQAPATPGVMPLNFRAEGFGEVYEETIELPVRPAVPWVEENGWKLLSEDEEQTQAISTEKNEGLVRYTEKVFDSPLGAYTAAREWLKEYPYGCLEQTTSRCFPLLAESEGEAEKRREIVSGGVRRVESMVRASDFVMWPDCNYAPWTREVSLYAAHFLFAAERAGYKLVPLIRDRVRGFVKRWMLEDDLEVSAYAALVAVVGGVSEKDRLYRLYDDRLKLSALARSRLALAMAEIGDVMRAKTLLEGEFEPQSVKEAAFRVMALVKVDATDRRILPLVAWLDAKRDRARLSWGTTEENAHALMAIGAYYEAMPPKAGEKFIAWRRLTLPGVEDMKDDQSGLFIDRRFLTSDGNEVDLDNLNRGELIFTELTITSAVTRVVNDLVVQDLLPAAFEPVLNSPITLPHSREWVMRSDARDDRMLVFSKQFTLEAGNAAKFIYPVRVVTAGDFILPGASVEGMYDPLLHARRACGRIVVRP